MAVEERFGEAAARLLEEDPELEQGRMFNAVGLKTAGRFFAMVVKGDLVVKLPAERVSELVAGGAGSPFESGGRRMREWISLQPPDEEACAAYMLEARDFVAALASSAA